MPAARVAQRRASRRVKSPVVTILRCLAILLFILAARTSVAQQVAPVRAPSDTRPTGFPDVPLAFPQQMSLAQDSPDITRVPPVEEIPAPGGEFGVPTDQPLPSADGHSVFLWPEPHPTAARRQSGLLSPFRERASNTHEPPTRSMGTGAEPSMPGDFDPWWQHSVTAPLTPSLAPYSVDVESLILQALQFSSYVRAISDTPLVRETAVIEAEADFDVRAFMESKYDDLSTPVGNLLETGGPSRFRDNKWTYVAGVRKRSWIGGNLEVSQRFGYQDNNSNFFVPTQQGTGRLSLSYTQPLLRGQGYAVNTSVIVLAEIDSTVAWDQFSELMQDQLLDVTQAYWELYMWRSILLQRERHLGQAQKILDELEIRREIDTLQSQVVRARAAVATRRAELVRAEASIRNSQTQIRSLVNAPDLVDSSSLELVPAEPPKRDYISINVRDALLTALQHRPEVDAALQRIRASSVRLNVSKNELLPLLDFVMETYVSGLEGRSDIGQAWVNQFNVGEPSYSVGLQFEVPWGNRAAVARYKRRRIEARQLVAEFNTTIERLMGEVEVAVREVKTSYREMEGHYCSMLANEADARYLEQRWRLLPGEDRARNFVLEDLLDSQDRLVSEEFAFARSQFAYTLSLTKLNRSMGTLLNYEQVSVRRGVENGLPRIHLDKPRMAELPEETPADQIDR
ncbi:MAG: TolC family protein [Pirellulales bacterium]